MSRAERFTKELQRIDRRLSCRLCPHPYKPGEMRFIAFMRVPYMPNPGRIFWIFETAQGEFRELTERDLRAFRLSLSLHERTVFKNASKTQAEALSSHIDSKWEETQQGVRSRREDYARREFFPRLQGAYAKASKLFNHRSTHALR